MDGKRSGLFFEILRLAQEIKPKFIFLENVPAITCRGGLQIVREIASLGYDCRWCVISAASIGALHRRERWFLLANSKYDGTFASENGGSIGECLISRKESGESTKGIGEIERASGISGNVANTGRQSSGSIQGCREAQGASLQFTGRSRFWEVEPTVGRLADGISNRVDKLRALGNSVVPQQVKEAFEILIGIKRCC